MLHEKPLAVEELYCGGEVLHSATSKECDPGFQALNTQALPVAMLAGFAKISGLGLAAFAGAMKQSRLDPAPVD